MKKSFAALILLTLLAIPSFAEEGKTKSITTNPLGMAFGVYNAEFQMHLAESKSALGIGGFFWKPRLFDLTSFGADISYNFYSKGGFEGLWLKPSVSLGYAKWENFTSEWVEGDLVTTTIDEGSFAVAIDAIVGYKWTWESGYTMGLAAGYGYNLGSYDGLADFAAGGISAAFDIGYAF